MESFMWIVLVAVFIFLLLREFFCWYHKINERINLSNEMIELLHDIKKNTARKPWIVHETPKPKRIVHETPKTKIKEILNNV